MTPTQVTDIAEVYNLLRKHMTQIADGSDVASSHCKYDVYQLKCWLDEQYRSLPRVAGEETWEQKRLINRLRQP